MTSAGHKREVTKYFLLLLVALGTGALVLFGSVALRFAEETAERDRVDRFHVRTLLLTMEAGERIPRLRSALGDKDESGASARAALQTIDSNLHSIGDALARIAELQAEFSANAMADTVSRARQQFEAITGGLDDLQPEELDRLTAALGLSLYQLGRLHTIQVTETLEATDRNAATRNLWAYSVSAAVVLGAGFIILRVFWLLRQTLRRHADLEEALLSHERQLQQSQKMEALGTLVGGVAHDFNNLLTAILGNTEFLLATVPPGAPSESGLREILKAGHSAAGLTRQLLAFSRPELARPRIVDLCEILHDMEPLVRRLVRGNIDISFECEAGLRPVLVDPVQMEQVIINLAVNASDAMPDGGSLSIEESSVEFGDGTPPPEGMPAGRFVRMSVTDSGHGMSPKTRERIFEPFFTTKARGKGTGLGLSTVHGIVSESQGFIHLDSQPGYGSRFDVYFPAREDEADLPETTAARDVLGGSETILLAEDTEAVRTFTAAGLTHAGYTVLIAEDGNDALRVCAEHPGVVHGIITDIVMPLMGGPQLAAAVRELYPGIRVVFITGYSEELVSGVGGRDHAATVIAKPFSMDELLAVVRHELDARVAGPGTHEPSI